MIIADITKAKHRPYKAQKIDLTLKFLKKIALYESCCQQSPELRTLRVRRVLGLGESMLTLPGLCRVRGQRQSASERGTLPRTRRVLVRLAESRNTGINL